MTAHTLRARIDQSLGNLVLVFHFTFVLFAGLGGFLVLWKRWIAWFQIPAVLWASFAQVFSHVCPLTPLENKFRRLAGQAGYEGGFIAHYITPSIYGPEGMPRRMERIAGYSVFIGNAFIYALVVTLRRRKSDQRAMEEI